MTVEQLEVIITANSSDLRRELGRTQSSLSELEKSSIRANDGMLKGFQFLKTGIIALGIGKLIQGIMGGMSGAISRLDTLNNYPRVMSNLGASNEDAIASVTRLSDKLLGLPTTMDTAVASIQRFTSSNNNVKASTEMFLALNNAILAGGAPMYLQANALEQLSQSYSKGKPDMMEWRSIMSVMPAQLKQTAQAMGFVSADALGEALRGGKINMNDFMLTLMKLNKTGYGSFKSFEEQARNSTGGVGTSIINVKTAIARGMADIMNVIGQSNIASFFQMIARAINSATLYVSAFVKATIMAVSWVSKLFGGGKAKTDNVKKAADQTASSMSNLGGAAGGASSDMNGATGSAKKLKKELLGLASFDEMNVLKDTSSDASGGSGGGAGGGAGLDLSNLNIDDSDEGKKELNKIDGILRSIMNNPFVTGFKDFWMRLGEGIKIVVDRIAKIIPQPIKDFFDAIKNNETVAGILEAVAISLGVLAGALTAGLIVLGLYNIAMGVATFVTGAFTAVMAVLTSPIVLVIAAIALLIGIVAILVKNWDKVKETASNVWASIVNVWEKVAIWFKTNVTDPVGKFFTEVWDTVKATWSTVVDFFKGIWENVKIITFAFVNIFANYFLLMWNNVSTIINGIKEIFSTVFNGIKDFVSKILNGDIKGAFVSLGNTVGSVFGIIWNTITSIFGNVKTFLNGAISQIGSTVHTVFANVVNTIAKFLENTVNGFIRGINKAIGIINNIPGVKIGTLREINVPRMAQGGIVNRPTLAVVGEAGREAVMPLENNTGWITELANKISNIGGGSGNSQIIIKLGEETIYNKFLDFVDKKSFQQNEAVIRV